MYFSGTFQTRAKENGEKYIDAYFAVFNQETEIWPGAYEQIAPGAFANSLYNNDIRCLFNHDSGLVLGRTGNQTLTLAEDEHGLKGSVRINPNDKQAMDIYARVERGDIAGCSFGFSPVAEDTEWRDDGTVHWRVKEADTAEVSICTFPAYPQTSVMARKQGFEEARRQRMEQEKEALKKRLEALK